MEILRKNDINSKKQNYIFGRKKKVEKGGKKSWDADNSDIKILRSYDGFLVYFFLLVYIFFSSLQVEQCYHFCHHFDPHFQFEQSTTDVPTLRIRFLGCFPQRPKILFISYDVIHMGKKFENEIRVRLFSSLMKEHLSRRTFLVPIIIQALIFWQVNIPVLEYFSK